MDRTRMNRMLLISFASVFALALGLPSVAQSGGNPVSIIASATEGPAPLLVSFSGAVAKDIQATYNWDFGDGSAHSSEQKVDHTFPVGGFYTVVLTVKDPASAWSGSATVIIHAWDKVRASATASPTSGAGPLTVNFYASVSGGKPPYLFYWDFGDGTGMSKEQNPVHIYSTSGHYNVFLTVFDSVHGGALVSHLVVGVTSPGALQGRVGIGSEGSFYLLDGQGITFGVITAKEVFTGKTTQANIVGGIYSFPALPPGTYDLTASLTYTDFIPYDADLLTYGCPGPSGGTLLKQIISRPVRIDLSASPQAQDVVFPPPLVFLHGTLDCYQKWYSAGSDPALTRMWDNDARANGYLSFTPNYAWWVTQASWPQRAEEVYQELASDLTGLSSVPPPAVIVAHDMGGLVARVLMSGTHDSDPLLQKVRRIYLLGTPNSGSDLLVGGGNASPLSQDAIIRRFNQTYPDFGGAEVYAIGGSQGQWGLANTDGSVSLQSAFTIAQQVCSTDAFGFPVCKNFPVQMFDSGAGHIFPYGHSDLGSPTSAVDILENTIIPWVSGLSAARAPLPAMAVIGPRSPVGATIWGTSTRTIGSGSKSLPPSYRPEAAPELDLPFQVSKTDGMLISAQVLAGSADFQVVSPSGAVLSGSASSPYYYNLVNPQPGSYVLKVTPGAEGVMYSATAAEGGVFGVSGFLTQDVYNPGDTALLRLDFDGLSPLVRPSDVTATITDGSGNLVAQVALYDDGLHQDGQAGDGLYGGTTVAPPVAGSYSVAFVAHGTYQGAEFGRTDLANLYVVPTTHMLTGQFSEAPADMDNNGSLESLRFTAGLTLQAGSTVVVSGDLYDSAGFFIAHAVAQTTGSSQAGDSAVLTFSLQGITCSQVGAPFQVRNLMVAEPSSLVPLDVWPGPVATNAYPSTAFACLPGSPHPAPSVVNPDQAVQGQALSVNVSGVNFQKGATLASDAGLAFSGTTFFSNSLLSTRLFVLPGASPGAHAFTVTNPDGTSGTVQGAFTVITNRPPSVYIFTPEPDAVVNGPLIVAARATDDVAVQSVAFILDGVPMATVASYPFQWTLDGVSLASGTHTITARATDGTGLTSEDSVVVYKDPPVVSSITKLANPFRLKVTGSNFQPGCQVFIGTDIAPWGNVRMKDGGTLLIKGGASLKARFPRGQAVSISIKNPNGTKGQGSFKIP